jgi:S-(hydroxymethyl)glutathione dehydrogenase/alcohol dehydrogenase
MKGQALHAAVLDAFNTPLVAREVTVGDIASDEVLVRVLASGICHSDRTVHLGAQDRPLPLILGHEAAGLVERVGDAVRSVQPGDLVVACSAAFCGNCSWCLRGQPQHCDTKRGSRGPTAPPRLTDRDHEVHAFVGLGGFASQMLLSDQSVVPVPETMPPGVAALLGCAVLTGMGAVRHRAKVRYGETVAVIGCGGVGLNAVQGARLAGASRVVAVDLNPAKLDRATRFGATDLVNAAQEDPVDAVRGLTGGGVDHVLEVVGRAGTIEQAFAMCRTRGTVTIVGVTRPDETVTIPAIEFMAEKRLQGSRMGSSNFRIDVPLYCDMYMRGDLLLDDLISDEIELSDVNRGLEQLDGSDGARSVIRFD